MSLFLFLLICFFHREILALILLFRSDLLKKNPELFRRSRVPQLLMSAKQEEPILIFPFFRSRLVTVNESFWNQLTAAEQEVTLMWAEAAFRRTPVLLRLAGLFRPSVVDRDALFLGANSLSLISLLEKLFRLPADPLRGLDPSGLGLFGLRESLEFRLQNLQRENLKTL